MKGFTFNSSCVTKFHHMKLTGQSSALNAPILGIFYFLFMLNTHFYVKTFNSSAFPV